MCTERACANDVMDTMLVDANTMRSMMNADEWVRVKQRGSMMNEMSVQ